MASARNYSVIVREIFDELNSIISRQSSPRPDGAETICVRDHDVGNYLIVRYGWRDGHRIRAVSMFVRLQGGRVFIEEDMTDWGLLDRMIEKGIAAEDIVLAFQPNQSTAADTMSVPV